ncbi:MAG TPA: hypothetical protein VGS12_13450 [Caulobacteraceae bacterium]|nr:hypothetical protein [Caulobacteraceae bacterium]
MKLTVEPTDELVRFAEGILAPRSAPFLLRLAEEFIGMSQLAARRAEADGERGYRDGAFRSLGEAAAYAAAAARCRAYYELGS